jgi:hypothetical protein
MSQAAALALLVVVALGCRGHDASRSSAAPPAETAPSTDSPSAESPSAESPPNSGAVEIYDAAQLSGIADRLAHEGTSGRTFGGHPAFHYVESRRVTSGTPEIHGDWIDVTLVQAGRATLLSGGRVRGGSLVSPGEHRGGSIDGGSSRPIAAGDLIVVPAGVPHQFRLAAGDSIRYLTIKIAR